MKRGFTLFVFSCAVSVALAQPAQPAAPSGFDANANLANAASSMFRTFDNRYEGVKGGTTIFPDFVYGSVNMKNGERAEGQELNYDAIANELIVRSRVYKKVLAVRPDLVNTFELINAEGDTLEFKKATAKGFVQVLHEGKTKLYLKHSKQLVKATIGGAYNSAGKAYDEFIDVKIYLISINGAELTDIKPSRKVFEAQFPELKNDIKDFVKKNDIDFKKDSDIVRVVEFIDSKG